MCEKYSCFYWLVLFVVAGLIGTDSNVTTAQEQERIELTSLQTVAEKSNFTATSSSAEVDSFIDSCTKASHVRKHVIGQTVEGRDLVCVSISQEFFDLDHFLTQKSENPGYSDESVQSRNIVLIIGNIHSGECSGKEAMLALMRELAANPQHPWLAEYVILMVPNYNADANDRVGKLNRPGQLGPVDGMGRRENAQELDLNRDFVKLEAPESRALVKLIDVTSPQIFVDCHTTNGSKHRYPLTYDIPHNPATAVSLREYLRNRMMPKITEEMEKKNFDTFYYGNFEGNPRQWVSFGHEPRYSTEYVGLRGGLAILAEDYSYADYRTRVTVTGEFLKSILDYATANSAEIRGLVASVKDEWRDIASGQPYRLKISLAAKATPFEKKVRIKGFEGEKPIDIECEHVANYVSTQATPMPYAYVIPKRYSRVIDRLLMHGIVVKQLSPGLQAEVEVDTIVEIKEARFIFQKHRNKVAQTTRKTVTQALPYLDYVVFTEQPLGRLAGYLLESSSDDGLLHWNFFDDVIAKGADYPVLRLPDVLQVAVEDSLEIDRDVPITHDLIDGPRSLLNPGGGQPRWYGTTNLLMTQYGQRPTLFDGRTASFVDRPALPVSLNSLQALGVSREQAEAFIEGSPLVAVNKTATVLKDGKRSAIVFHESKAKETLLDLGGPVDPALPSSEKNPGELFEFNHDESYLGFVTNAGLNFLNLKRKKVEQVKAPTPKHLVGKLDWVYQEELYGRGNFKAFWWNPTGDEVAFLSLDETNVSAFTVTDHLPIKGESELTSYPKAGEPLPIVKVGVVNANDAATVNWIDLSNYGNQEILVSRVTWANDGSVLLIQVQNREQTWLDLVATDRNGRNPKVLFRDQTPAWIESPGDPVFISDREFLWVSPRDGIRRIYQYDLDGKLQATVTRDDWEVRDLLGIDPARQFAYFTGSENPLELHCYRLEIANRRISRITQAAGTHTIEFSHDFSTFLDKFSDLESPLETRVCDADGTLLRKLNVSSDDRLSYLGIKKPELIKINSGEGVELDAMLIKPVNFTEGRKYPILIHVYGGPQAPRVRNRFDGAFYLWHQMLAQNGYIVCIIDNRSASFRNTRDAWPIHKQLAVQEMSDIEQSVKWLAEQSWVDQNRIGIWGWSYGGYMTLYAMTHSNLFKVGIAGAPVTDWRNYDAIYAERYMGLPQDNREGYQKSSVLEEASQLHGKLLLIHGTVDDNVHLNNSMQFVKELQDAGMMFDMMFYPANRHSITLPKQTIHLRKLMTDYILKNL